MFRAEAKAKIARELEQGMAARQAGQEGRARVCARRAAGAAIREYLELRDQPSPGMSAYDLLAYLQQLSDVSPEIRQSAGHLLARVDENYALPIEADLLLEARRLAEELDRMDC